MGTDIHLRVQKRDASGRWQFAEEMIPNKYADEEGEKPTKPRVWYNWRDYDCFSILADVRNGYGFAGVVTGVGFVPIAKPRGLPEDFPPTDDGGTLPDGFWIGDHSFSWLTYRELEEYDWAQETVKQGWVTAPQYEDWNRYRREDGDGPDSYCGGASGSSVRNIAEKDMIELLTEFRKREFSDYKSRQQAMEAELGHTYCQVNWTELYSVAATRFYLYVMPRLKKLAAGDPDSVRIVFGFDS